MTFEKLAELVSKDFQKTMDNEGFETFREMRKCYCWNMQDIKAEVYSIITELSEEYWKKYKRDFWMSDDYSFIQIGVCQEMSWGDFKKLVFSNLK